MASIRESFVEHFCEEEATKLEIAALGHANGVNSQNKGSDSFKWVVLICLGYQCVELEGYREYHKITTDWDDFKKWVKQHANLDKHDGDCDYLALFSGVYDEFVEKQVHNQG